MALPASSLHIVSVMLIFATSFLAVRCDDHFDFGSPKKTHLHFYMHDVLSGASPTAVVVVIPPKVNTTTAFGAVVVADDPLTMGPQRASKPLGRGQGTYTYVSQEYAALLLSLDLVFTEGAYAGSSITIFGRYSITTKVREIPVLGGTGYFRGARGYVLAQTYSSNNSANYEIVENRDRSLRSLIIGRSYNTS